MLCVGDCLIAQPERFLEQHSPYLWPTLASPEQASEHWAAFVGTQLARGKAVHAGSKELAAKKRVFGVVHYDDDAGTFRKSVSHFEDLLGTYHVKPAVTVPYTLDLSTAQEDARLVITKLQTAGVTSVLLAGDPVFPTFLTKRSHDAGLLPRVGGARLRVHRHRGVRPPVRPEAVVARVRSVVAPCPHRRRHRRARQPDHLADRHATVGEDVPRARAGSAGLLHRRAPRGSARSPRRRSAPGSSVSRRPPTPRRRVCISRGDGTTSGRASTSPAATTPPSCGGIPTATGPDEVGRDGNGLYRYADEGKRYLPGKWPTTPVGLYDDATSVTVLTQLPPRTPHPSYPSPA